jgi:IS4 transposase
LTNNFALKPEWIAELYHQRWQVQLFFQWIRQHLRIKVFLGTSENAVKTQQVHIDLPVGCHCEETFVSGPS